MEGERVKLCVYFRGALVLQLWLVGHDSSLGIGFTFCIHGYILEE